MDRKTKNTILLAVILLVIVLIGGVYTFVIQNGKIDDKNEKLKEINLNAYNTDDLIDQLLTLQARAAELDSILSLRKYNVPVVLRQSRFFDFVNNVSFGFSPQSFVNISYKSVESETHFKKFIYAVEGTATFNDLYKLIYAIEQSKELKKVSNVAVSNFVNVDQEGFAHYLVSFKFDASVYFSDNDRFASSTLRENRLTANPLYDVFYPLIRNEIPPNVNNLLDVQTGQLLALIPEGAFVADAKGNTYLLWEGDEVYLGYLTEIDYQNSQVHFILNKGGIIEKVSLSLVEKNVSK
ncbi:MAG: hypothetical protein QY331_13905 [Melioribacteraceae bacterium]|jgi:hypothetical protein|nr:MAG: hypothetical protein QY331_13905 [Melioribacteraceae bacterium]